MTILLLYTLALKVFCVLLLLLLDYYSRIMTVLTPSRFLTLSLYLTSTTLDE